MKEDLIKFESLIDEKYKTQDVFDYTPRSMIQMVLSLYDVVHNLNPDKLDEMGKEKAKQMSLFLPTLHSGVSHCLRWVIDSKGTQKAIPKNENEQLKSAEFLWFGCTYNLLCEKISLSHKKYFDYSIDFENRKAIFNRKHLNSFAYSHFQKESRRRTRDSFERTKESTGIIKFCMQTYFRTRNNNLFEALNWPRFLSTIEYLNFRNFFSEQLLPELAGDTDLGGYTLDEFRTFYTSLYLISQYDVAIGMIGLNITKRIINLPGAMIQAHFQFIKSFCFVTGLNYVTVERIIHDMTFDTNKFGSKILSRPFIFMDGMLSWLPNLIFRGFPKVLLSNLFYRDKKNIYDAIITEIERIRLKEIKIQLSKIYGKYRVSLMQNSDFIVDSVTISPDIVLENKAKKEFLIIEFKYAVSAYTPYDVSTQFTSIKKHFNQLLNYKTKLGELFVGYKIYGIILFNTFYHTEHFKL